DDEDSDRWDLVNFDLGPASGGWTIDVANSQYWDDRGFYQGAQPDPKFNKPGNRPESSALPFGVSYETFRNPGPRVSVDVPGVAAVTAVQHAGHRPRVQRAPVRGLLRDVPQPRAPGVGGLLR